MLNQSYPATRIKWKNESLPVILVVTLLTIIGLLAIYSAGNLRFTIRQLCWLPFAVMAFLFAYRLPQRLLFYLAYPLFFFGIFLLILVLIFGSGVGAKRWFNFGLVSFQPSEFIKLTTVLALARFLSMRRKFTFRFADLILPILFTLVPALLILAEPDLGSALVFLPILAVMLYWKGLNLFQIFLLFSPLLSFVFGYNLYTWIGYFVLLVIILFWQGNVLQSLVALGVNSLSGLLEPLVWSCLKDYQRARITNFLAPWVDPKGIGWNLIQSQIAIGSGRLWGKGYLSGTQKRLEFLPNRHTDFIFSVIGEEFGFIGCLLVLLLFFFLLYRLALIARYTRDEFASLAIIGFTTIIAYQVIVNIGMLLGLMPITGIALPFLSYGGTSLLFNFTMIGLALNLQKSPD
ncbi:MAG: rod shape-determining protein RodA [candidate division WOR-3 bacterium]